MDDSTQHSSANGTAAAGEAAEAPEAAPSRGAPGRHCVLQVLPSLETGGGGVERSALDIAAALKDVGAVPLVASAGGAQVRELERHGVEHVQMPLKTKNPLALRVNADRLAQLIEARAVDVVHARSRAPAWSAYQAARRTGRPFLTTFHGAYGHGSRVKRWYNSVMARGDRVIANSDFIARHVEEVYGVPRTRIVVIPRGVDTDILAPDNVSQERMIQLAERWRLPDGAGVVMLPGRLSRWKGQPLLIEAMARVERDDVICLLVGSDQGRTGYSRELEQLIEKAGLGGKVVMVDHCTDMAAAYKLADVVVSASTDPEAFGRIVSEAQAMGRPVVVADHGGAPEQILPGETGWTFPPGDAAALAAAIEDALDLDETARSALSERARAHALSRYTKRAMCAATLRVYADLLAGRAERPLDDSAAA